jgi:hypothetical protein
VDYRDSLGCRICWKRADETCCTQGQARHGRAGLGWAQDYSQTNIRLIGFVEIVGAVGLVLPAALHIAPILVPLAAVGLALVMVGAIVVHARRKEPMNIVVNVVLIVLAVIVALGRFGPYSFTP